MRHWRLSLASTAVILCCAAVPAQATPSVSAADKALRHWVEHRYPGKTEERDVATRCRRISVHHHPQFSCLYGIRANSTDVTLHPYAYWLYSGLAQVYVHGRKLTVERIGALTAGGTYAPYRSPIEGEGLKEVEREAKESEEQFKKEQEENNKAFCSIGLQPPSGHC